MQRASIVMLAVLAVLAIGCEGFRPSDRLNRKASAAKLDAIQPRLERFAAAHPDRADEVADILATWPDRPERHTFDRVWPIMAEFAAENPDEADDVWRVLDSWERRLRQFEP